MNPTTTKQIIDWKRDRFDHHYRDFKAMMGLCFLGKALEALDMMYVYAQCEYEFTICAYCANQHYEADHAISK